MALLFKVFGHSGKKKKRFALIPSTPVQALSDDSDIRGSLEIIVHTREYN